MTYNLLLKGKGYSALQWFEKPDGSTVHSSSEEWSFLVKSNSKDSISSDDFLKQTGCKLRGFSKPSYIRNRDGWTIQVV